jgi:hypothetical protein
MTTRRDVLRALVAAAMASSLKISPAYAESPIKLQNWKGTIDFSPTGTSSFALDGTASTWDDSPPTEKSNFIPATTGRWSATGLSFSMPPTVTCSSGL